MFRRCLCQILFVISGKSAVISSIFAASITEENETDIYPFIKYCMIKKKIIPNLMFSIFNEQRMC